MFHSSGLVVGIEQCFRALEGAADLRAAVFAEVVEGVLVDFLGADVMHDVAALDAFVILAQPGVDPEALEADELLLLLAHGARHVHHEDDDGVALGALDLFPASVTDVLLLRDDDRRVGVVVAEHDLALQGLLEGALEVAQALRADPANAAVFVARGRDAMLALGFDAREFQLFGEDFGELVEREVDLHDVLAGFGAALRFALAGLALADDVAFLAVAGANAAGVVAVAEMRQLDPAHGDADEVLALLADQLTLGEELPQVVADASLDDLAEALVIFFDLQDHNGYFTAAFATDSTGGADAGASGNSGGESARASGGSFTTGGKTDFPCSRRNVPNCSEPTHATSSPFSRRAVYAPNCATLRS